MVSLSALATTIQTCDQSSGADCFDQQVRQENKNRNKTNTNCAPDGSVTLANRFFEWNCNDLTLVLTTVEIIFGEQLHLFL